MLTRQTADHIAWGSEKILLVDDQADVLDIEQRKIKVIPSYGVRFYAVHALRETGWKSFHI